MRIFTVFAVASDGANKDASASVDVATAAPKTRVNFIQLPPKFFRLLVSASAELPSYGPLLFIVRSHRLLDRDTLTSH
jgi:hypothetical protein